MNLSGRCARGLRSKLPGSRIPIIMLVFFFSFKSKSKYIWEQGSLGLSSRSLQTLPLSCSSSCANWLNRSPLNFPAGQLKKAASWLFKNAEPLKSLSLPERGRESQGPVAAWLISGVEVKAESVCICFIDDCMDCDVPLAELTFSRECAPDVQIRPEDLQ